MTNLKKILTTLPAVTLKHHCLRFRQTAFGRSFKIIQHFSRCGYSRGCMFIPVSTLYYGLDLLRLVIGMSSEKRQPADFRESKKKNAQKWISLFHLSVKLLEAKCGRKCFSGFLFHCCINTFSTPLS